MTQSEAARLSWKDPEIRRRRIEGNKRNWAKTRKSRLATFRSTEYKKSQKEGLARAVAEKKAQGERWQSEEGRGRIASSKRGKKNPMSNTVARTKMSRALRELWQSPKRQELLERCVYSHRKKLTAAEKQFRADRLFLKELRRFDSEAYRKEISWRFSRAQKLAWQDPTVRRNRVAGTRRATAEGRKKPSGGNFYQFKRGFIETRKAGRVQYRSSWEQLLFELLDNSRLVKSFVVEPFPIRYKHQGEFHNYFPDCLVTMKDGRQFLVEIKGQIKEPKNKAKFKAARNYCTLCGIEFKVFTEKVQSLSALVN